MPTASAPAAASPDLGLRTAGSVRRGLAAVVDGVPLLTLWLATTFGLGASTPGPLADSRWNLLDRVVDAINQTPIVIALPLALLLLALFLWHFVSLAVAGTTPGKRVLGLRVVDRRGDRPHAARVLIHSALRVLSLVLLASGHWWSLADRDRRTLYDRAAGVWVVSEVIETPPAG